MSNYPPRLAKGKMVLGPEYTGCVNTGMRPALLHSKLLANHPVARGYRFVIGPELFVQEAVTRLVLGRVPVGQAFVETKDWRVTFAKTYATAKRRHAFLSQEIMDWNTQERRRSV